MPTVPAMPPADRCFAHLDKFQCDCPNCGRLLDAALRDHRVGKGQKGKARGRLAWNPFTQRLDCPYCHASFAAGLVLYPAAPYTMEPPPDVVRTQRERRMEQRRGAGGWCVEGTYVSGTPVNLYVQAPCSCPRRGWSSGCPLHGRGGEALP